MPRPAVGDLAPDFTLLTDAGTSLTLSSLRGKPVVLYFYPRDDTPTCTTEACGFRDRFPSFRRARAVVLGVSPDTVKSHAKFKAKYALPFTLLADTGREAVTAYDVWREKTLYGRVYMGVERTTFLIDPSGVVAGVWEKVRSDGHAEAVMAAIEALAGRDGRAGV